MTTRPPRAAGACIGIWGLAAALLVSTPQPAGALTLTVPDDVPTIQAALDAFALSYGAAPDTLRLRGADFPEVPALTRPVVVEVVPRDPAEPRPRIAGLGIQLMEGVLVIRGIHFTGPLSISVDSPSEILFQDCRFQAGVLQGSSDGLLGQLTFRRCTFRASARLAPGGECVIDSCEVEASAIYANWSDASLTVTNSTFRGAGSGVAIGVDNVTRLTVSNTTIRGYAVGILADAAASADVHDNTIEDCSFAGISVDFPASTTRIERNVVRRCGAGIRAWGDNLAVVGNRIEDCSGTGLAAFDATLDISENVIARCDGDGMLLGWGQHVRRGACTTTPCVGTADPAWRSRRSRILGARWRSSGTLGSGMAATDWIRDGVSSPSRPATTGTETCSAPSAADRSHPVTSNSIPWSVTQRWVTSTRARPRRS